MKWIRAHKHTVALIGMAIFVIVGGILAKNNAATVSESGDIKNVAVEYPYYVPPTSAENLLAINAQENPPAVAQGIGSASPLAGFFGRTLEPNEVPARQTAPIAMPQIISNRDSRITLGTSVSDQYLPFFRVLSNILSPIDARTPTQKALFDYGNEAGALIKNFESAHSNVTLTLKSFFDSRASPSRAPLPPEIADKYAQMITLIGGAAQPVPAGSAAANVQAAAGEYARLGAEIAGIQNVPPEARMANDKLAQCYANVANGLSKLTQTANDAQLLEAINAYNAGADECVKNYISLIDLFSMHGVKFSANDPGAMFSFSAQ